MLLCLCHYVDTPRAQEIVVHFHKIIIAASTCALHVICLCRSAGSMFTHHAGSLMVLCSMLALHTCVVYTAK